MIAVGDQVRPSATLHAKLEQLGPGVRRTSTVEGVRQAGIPGDMDGRTRTEIMLHGVWGPADGYEVVRAGARTVAR